MSFFPDIFVGMLSFTQLPVGTKLAGVFEAMARVSTNSADRASTTGGLRLTEAGWDRREEEWRHQVEVLDLELAQIERQILGAERRRDVALRELNNHAAPDRPVPRGAGLPARQVHQPRAVPLAPAGDRGVVPDDVRAGAARRPAGAARVQLRARPHHAGDFVPARPGTTCARDCSPATACSSACDEWRRPTSTPTSGEYELTKHVSLRLHFPLEFLRLQATGSCEIEVPEWMFDLDYPGHYMRRIKNVTVTIPCVVGPYTGVHAG